MRPQLVVARDIKHVPTKKGKTVSAKLASVYFSRCCLPKFGNKDLEGSSELLEACANVASYDEGVQWLPAEAPQPLEVILAVDVKITDTPHSRRRLKRERCKRCRCAATQVSKTIIEVPETGAGRG